MLNIETLKLDIACLKRVRENLEKYNAGEIAISIVDGMIIDNEHTIKCLEAEQEWLKAAAYGSELLKQGANQ